MTEVMYYGGIDPTYDEVVFMPVTTAGDTTYISYMSYRRKGIEIKWKPYEV
jgi:hypothetical protein